MQHCSASIIAPTIFVFLAIESLWTQKCYGPNLQVQTYISLFFSKSLDIGFLGSTLTSHAIWITLPHSRWVAHRSSNLCGIFFPYCHLPLVLCSDKYWNVIQIGCLQVSDLGLREHGQLWHMPCPTFPA